MFIIQLWPTIDTTNITHETSTMEPSPMLCFAKGELVNVIDLTKEDDPSAQAPNPVLTTTTTQPTTTPTKEEIMVRNNYQNF